MCTTLNYEMDIKKPSHRWPKGRALKVSVSRPLEEVTNRVVGKKSMITKVKLWPQSTHQIWK
jgi:hypothetical protein